MKTSWPNKVPITAVYRNNKKFANKPRKYRLSRTNHQSGLNESSVSFERNKSQMLTRVKKRARLPAFSWIINGYSVKFQARSGSAQFTETPRRLRSAARIRNEPCPRAKEDSSHKAAWKQTSTLTRSAMGIKRRKRRRNV